MTVNQKISGLLVLVPSLGHDLVHVYKHSAYFCAIPTRLRCRFQAFLELRNRTCSYFFHFSLSLSNFGIFIIKYLHGGYEFLGKYVIIAPDKRLVIVTACASFKSGNPIRVKSVSLTAALMCSRTGSIAQKHLHSLVVPWIGGT
ncbi:hypothetical protein C8J56DRAFT_900016 [Mycena floridula]|nr:hypothetical protein C8J56DRAFT_900016 [Mycena floridula]